MAVQNTLNSYGKYWFVCARSRGEMCVFDTHSSGIEWGNITDDRLAVTVDWFRALPGNSRPAFAIGRLQPQAGTNQLCYLNDCYWCQSEYKDQPPVPPWQFVNAKDLAYTWNSYGPNL
jgi:hypothetical protein